jgi:hypothetical protein
MILWMVIFEKAADDYVLKRMRRCCVVVTNKTNQLMIHHPGIPNSLDHPW